VIELQIAAGFVDDLWVDEGLNLVAWQLESGGGRESKDDGAVAGPVSARSGRHGFWNFLQLSKRKRKSKK
jgi:hypothetical protein